MLTDTQKQILSDVCAKLSCDPIWLDHLIAFESGWDPQRRAGMPYNQSLLDTGIDHAPRYARGLIQFIDSTAQMLGYIDSQDLVLTNPTIEKQLSGPVYLYLRQYAPFVSEIDLFMSVFYPVARKWDLMHEFPDSVKAANPGINNPHDYLHHVYQALRLKGGTIAGLTIGGIVALLALAFVIFKH